LNNLEYFVTEIYIEQTSRHAINLKTPKPPLRSAMPIEITFRGTTGDTPLKYINLCMLCSGGGEETNVENQLLLTLLNSPKGKPTMLTYPINDFKYLLPKKITPYYKYTGNDLVKTQEESEIIVFPSSLKLSNRIVNLIKAKTKKLHPNRQIIKKIDGMYIYYIVESHISDYNGDSKYYRCYNNNKKNEDDDKSCGSYLKLDEEIKKYTQQKMIDNTSKSMGEVFYNQLGYKSDQIIYTIVGIFLSIVLTIIAYTLISSISNNINKNM